ncbi:hypothetical protein Ancab_028367 [Ancistrocladus abbreviatus]
MLQVLSVCAHRLFVLMSRRGAKLSGSDYVLGTSVLIWGVNYHSLLRVIQRHRICCKEAAEALLLGPVKL